jgi:hypothetical protein
MNGSQQSLTSTNSSAGEPGTDAGKWWIEDENEIPLGCECANPVLQIERWGQEVPPGPPQPC